MTAAPLGALRRRPRLAGLLLAVALGAAYLGALRPLRVAVSEHVAQPFFETVRTERAAGFVLADRPGAPTLYAIPAELVGDGPVDLEDAAAHWSSPAGVLFVLPALFLAAAFPFRPYWLVLLGYHLAVGVIAAGVFAVGLGWAEWAFALSAFSQTYLLETVSLAVPLLLWLAGRAEAAQPSVAEAAA